MSKFNIGAMPGHRSSKHILVIKNLIQYSAFFDYANLEDVMLELHEHKIKKTVNTYYYII